MRLGLCSRSKDVIEPLLRPQWYMNCQDVAKVMVQKAESKELTIIPEDYNKLWNGWMSGIKDWCISRQIWWGHQCPAYQARFEGEDAMEREDRWLIARDLEEAQEKAALKWPAQKLTLHQDQDVLDTWFSSALLPFSVHQWPT